MAYHKSFFIPKRHQKPLLLMPFWNRYDVSLISPSALSPVHIILTKFLQGWKTLLHFKVTSAQKTQIILFHNQ